MSERPSRVGVEQTTCSMMIFCWYWNYRLTLVSTTYDDMIRIPFRHPRIYLTRGVHTWMYGNTAQASRGANLGDMSLSISFSNLHSLY